MEKTEAENSQTMNLNGTKMRGHKLGREMATLGSRAVFVDSIIVYFLLYYSFVTKAYYSTNKDPKINKSKIENCG